MFRFFTLLVKSFWPVQVFSCCFLHSHSCFPFQDYIPTFQASHSASNFNLNLILNHAQSFNYSLTFKYHTQTLYSIIMLRFLDHFLQTFLPLLSLKFSFQGNFNPNSVSLFNIFSQYIIPRFFYFFFHLDRLLS